MSGFKAMVDRDIRGVFINFAEFGETRIIEGCETVIVVDQDELKRRQGGQDLAVAESGTLFYARSDELPARRAAGETLTVDGRVCLIDDWKEALGMATVVLRQNITR